jgi:hypothetical protein
LIAPGLPLRSLPCRRLSWLFRVPPFGSRGANAPWLAHVSALASRRAPSPPRIAAFLLSFFDYGSHVFRAERLLG